MPPRLVERPPRRVLGFQLGNAMLGHMTAHAQLVDLGLKFGDAGLLAHAAGAADASTTRACRASIRSIACRSRYSAT